MSLRDTVVMNSDGVTKIDPAKEAGNLLDVKYGVAPQATMDHGRKSNIDTSAVVIGGSFVPKQGVLVKAHSSNTGIVFLGNSDVTADSADATDGYPLSAGESVFLSAANVNMIYAIGSANDQVVFWIAL